MQQAESDKLVLYVARENRKKISVVVARGLKRHFGKNLEEFESIKVRRMRAIHIRRELKVGRIKSAITISALFGAFYKVN